MSNLFTQFRRMAFLLPLVAIALGPDAGAQPSQTAASDRPVWVAARSEPAADSVVYRSTDGAEYWLPANNGLPRGAEALGLVADPSTPEIAYALIQVGTVRGGLYKTVDGGQSWQRKTSWKGYGSFESIALDPTRPQVVYLAGRNLLRSPDGGEHWRNLRARSCVLVCRAGAPGVRSFVIDPRHPKTMYASPGYKSTDGGRTWNLAERKACYRRSFLRRCQPEGGFDSLALDPRHPSVLYAGTGGIYKTTDGGRTWVKLTKYGGNRSFDALAVHPEHSNVVWAHLSSAAGFRVDKSTDGGRTWTRKTRAPPLLEEEVPGLAIDPHSPRTVYVTGMGVLKTSDGGATWAQKNAGLPSTGPPPIIDALAVE